MSRTAFDWNPIAQQTDSKEEMHLKTINLIIYIKGSKFDLINSDDASNYYTA